MSIFEIGKLFIKLRKFSESKDRLYISAEASAVHDNPEDSKKVKHIEKLFFKDDSKIQNDMEPEKLKQKLAKSLERIKNGNQGFRNALYTEKLGRSTKSMNIISNLPIPESIKSTI